MEGRKEEIKEYLIQNVNPLIEPMLQKIAEEKPTDVLLYISSWVAQKLGNLFRLFRLKAEINLLIRFR